MLWSAAAVEYKFYASLARIKKNIWGSYVRCDAFVISMESCSQAVKISSCDTYIIKCINILVPLQNIFINTIFWFLLLFCFEHFHFFFFFFFFFFWYSSSWLRISSTMVKMLVLPQPPARTPRSTSGLPNQFQKATTESTGKLWAPRWDLVSEASFRSVFMLDSGSTDALFIIKMRCIT